MSNESQQYRSVKFTTATLPWLLAAAMLVVYLLTINPWVTPRSVFPIADVSGWTAGQHFVDPLAWLVTLPLRVLPHTVLPLAFNIFSAVCGALVLCHLARCVALLPHDRTHAQRENEHNEAALNSTAFCWMPPVFAVLLCGLERTFWECATEGNGKILIVLVFSYCVKCLLEFRLDGDEKWFYKFALACGLGMANNWIMVALFPLFAVAVIWIKGITAFESGFIKRVLLLGFLGLLLVFLYPTINWHFNHHSWLIFWQTVRGEFLVDKSTIVGLPRVFLLLMSLTSLLPVFIMGIKWSSYFGDNSPFGIFVASSMLHLVHAMFLVAAIWVALDAPISARFLLPGFGNYFLPVYFLGALSAGYFVAYFLIVFSKIPPQQTSSMEPILKLVHGSIVVVVVLLAVLSPIMLIVRNVPFMRQQKGIIGKFDDFFAQIEKTLPSKPAVILSDDPFRLMYLRFHLSRHASAIPHLFVETASLSGLEGLQRIKNCNPGFAIAKEWTNIPAGGSSVLIPLQVLGGLQQKYELHYIHGSFGYYFERFYPVQHGLTSRLLPYAEGVWDVPPPQPEQITANSEFWNTLASSSAVPTAAQLLLEQQPRPVTNLWGKLNKTLRLKPEPDVLSPLLGSYYSRSMDDWGVSLQRLGKLDEASLFFQRATNANPENFSAQINLKVNVRLAEKGEIPYTPNARVLQEHLGVRGGWPEALFINGPVDEPSYAGDLATTFATGGNHRQAVQLYHRVIEMCPSDPNIKIQLAQLLLAIESFPNSLTMFLPHTNCYHEAITNTDFVLRTYPENTGALFVKSLALMQLKEYESAIGSLSKLVVLQPSNAAARLDRAIAYLQLEKLDSAKADYRAVAELAPTAYAAYFGLAEIAGKQKDKAAAVENYKNYLANAPAGTAEAAMVTKRLEELKADAP